jgi:hypothetical protein
VLAFALKTDEKKCRSSLLSTHLLTVIKQCADKRLQILIPSRSVPVQNLHPYKET